MKKMKTGRIIGYGFLALVLIFLFFIGYIWYILPRIPAPDLKVAITPERLARGKYLANYVTVCIDCNSTRDWNKFAGPIVPGTEGKGGEKFDRRMGFPGTFYAPNITPYALSSWSDGELYRAITSGVTKNNKPIFPVMPCSYYGKMATEDIYCIIAYIRRLPSIEGKPLLSKADFPVNIILHTLPQKPSPGTLPLKNDSVNYGKYLVGAAACVDCHSPVDGKNNIILEKMFSGGRTFLMPTGKLVSSNLTPDEETGIGAWSKERFISRFKEYDISNYKSGTLNKAKFLTVMPWTMYAGMDSTDIGAMFVYLKTVPALKNEVIPWTPAK